MVETSNSFVIDPVHDLRPFTVRKSKQLGRYLVASKELNEGERILTEAALIVGPKSDSDVICLGCYRTFDNDATIGRCTGCNWPLCSTDCKQSQDDCYAHSATECKYLKKINYSQQSLELIVPLRCLLLKLTNSEKWTRLMQLESHNRIRQTINTIWQHNQTIVDRLQKLFLPAQFSDLEIHSVCGILEVNSFEIGLNGRSIRGLYPMCAMMAHNCVPNTSHFDQLDYTIVIYASVAISKNQPITMTYTNCLDTTLRRRQHLKQSKFFDCVCARCKDCTELGTFMSALKCPRCRHGNVLPVKPLDDTTSNTSWQCRKRNCNFKTDQAFVNSLLNKLECELNTIETENINEYEKFLEKYQNQLHENHSIFIRIKYRLSQLYGKIPQMLINEMTIEQLQRKWTICENILQIFNRIDPGSSRLRGITLYELHAPIMLITLNDYKCKKITKTKFLLKMNEIKQILNESVTILSLEPNGSAEREIAQIADNCLRQLNDSIAIFKKN